MVYALGGIGVLLIFASIVCFIRAENAGGTFILGCIALMSALAMHANQAEHNVPKLSAQAACVQSSARSMPTSATINSIKDDRLGPIYPCYYLLDLGIDPGQAMPLSGEVQEAVFSQESFKATSKWSGWLLLGTGTAHGSSSAAQSVERKDEYAFMVQTRTGSLIKLVVDAERVRLASCVDPCKPSVKLSVTADSLYTKWRDDGKYDSIWLSRSGGARSVAVGRLSDVAPGDANGAITGGPKFPGEIIEALAQAVITLPATLSPTPAR